jgi:hypothetical protein
MLLIDGFEIDAELSGEHGFESEVTDHPVEQGADISDHVRPKPVVVTVEGVVSDTPVGPIADRRGDVNENGVLVNSPSQDALAWFLRLRDERQPVAIETSLRRFDSMILQSLSIPTDARTGKALRFRATFKQVRVVVNERSTVRVDVPRARRRQNLGNRPAATPPFTIEKTRKQASALADATGRSQTLFDGIKPTGAP